MNPILAIVLNGVAACNILRIASATQNGETFTIGPKVFQIKSLGGTLVSGRVAVDLTASPTAAKAALVYTFAANPTAADTVSINGQVYTYRASVGTTANEVLIGADLTATRNNLVAAVTGGAGSGTVYGSATVANTGATAAALSTNAFTATALVAGTAGNSIAVAEAGAQTSWAGGAVALAGGVDPTAAETITAAVAAINGVDSGLTAVAITGGIFLYNNKGLTTPIPCTETLAGSNNAFNAAVTYGGKIADGNGTLLYAVTPTALDVTLGVLRIPLNFTPSAWTVDIRDSTGAAKAFGGTATLSGQILVLTNGTDPDFAATDKVTVTAQR